MSNTMYFNSEEYIDGVEESSQINDDEIVINH